MTTLNVNTIKPAGSTLTLGESGDTVVVTDDVKVNTVKDGGDGYRYASFTTTGANTWTCPTGVTSAEIVTVAGGGGGAGSNHAAQSGGGAGAGGVVHNTSYTVVPAVVYDITVGAGGAGGVNNVNGSTGSNSVFNVNAEGSGSTVTALGGAEGAAASVGQDGGSGGGSGQGNATGGSATQGDSGGGTGYGEDGGGGGAAQYSASGGGSGGAGEAGDTTGNKGGTGGTGRLFSNFTAYGTDSGYFAGGGSGGSISVAAPGSPTGGGGVGGMDSDGGAGTANTGGGGGGAGGATADGGAGGSGIVLIRYQDPTPNTLWVSNGSGVLSSVKAGIGGAEKLLSTQTASGASSVAFTSGIDSTYKEYIFKCININPATNAETFGFQVNASGESGYNETITSTYFRTYHQENDGGADGPGFQSSPSQDNGTALQNFIYAIGNEADESGSGELHLFNPSSTTYVKNFIATSNSYAVGANDLSYQVFAAGYINTTTAITQIEFKMTSGNFDGKIKMYGIAS